MKIIDRSIGLSDAIMLAAEFISFSDKPCSRYTGVRTFTVSANIFFMLSPSMNFIYAYWQSANTNEA